jgi:hypothetical protein
LSASSSGVGATTARRHIVFGASIEDGGDLASLRAKILDGTLCARRVDAQPDGDTRYWGVDTSQSVVLHRLKEFGELHFVTATNRPPALSFIMVNHIDAAKCPGGSGGGWHRDSTRRQFKAFAYLTEVDREAHGAFCFIPASNAWPFRVVTLLYRLLSGGNRYPDRAVAAVLKAGVRAFPVLAEPAIPFFVNTSLIHRGLPISEGQRMMATVYMFEEVPPELAYLR